MELLWVLMRVKSFLHRLPYHTWKAKTVQETKGWKPAKEGKHTSQGKANALKWLVMMKHSIVYSKIPGSLNHTLMYPGCAMHPTAAHTCSTGSMFA